MKKGSKHSIETRIKLVKNHVGTLGKKMSKETKLKMSLARKAKWARMTLEERMKYSTRRKGIPLNHTWRQNLSKAHMGYKPTIVQRKKLSIAQKNRVAKGLHHLWKGGITKSNNKIRHSMKYRIWRERVLSRDNYTCVHCGIKNKKGLGRSVKFHVDHIKQFAYYPELRFSVDNGRTLCKPCHEKTPTYRNRIKITKD